MRTKVVVYAMLLCAMAAQGVVLERRFKPRTYRYPAPREVRLLDGEWEYRTHSNNQESAEDSPWVKVQTPYVGATNNAALRVTHTYRRTFDMPALAGRRAIIHFECIPGVCEVTVNGQLVFVHGPGGVPFDVDVTDVAKEGENAISFDVRQPRAEEEVRNGGIWRTDSAWVVNCTLGYMRPIYLESRPPVSVEDIVIVTRIEGGKRIEVRTEITNTTDAARQVTLEGRVGDFSLGGKSLTLPPQGGVTATLSKDWPDAALWTPDDPNLYLLDLDVKEDSRTIDARRERFGFREITWKKDKVFLNGIHFMLKRTPGLGYWHPDDAHVAEVIDRLKRRGLNGARTPPPCFAQEVDVADEKGFFISASRGARKARDYKCEEAWKCWKDGVLEMVKAYRNHPSIVAWGIGGEMGYVYGLTADAETNKFLVAKMQDCGRAVAALDPTRPWVCHGDNDVCLPGMSDGPATVRTWHYPNPPTGDKRCLPESAWWYKRGEKSYHNVADREKPICFGEDLYHGFHDQFFGLSKWGGDAIWTLDGYLKAWHDCVWMLADGYYDGDLAGWTIWCAAEIAPSNRLFDVIIKGQLTPDYLVSIREPFRNLRSGIPEKRTLTVYNKRFRDRRVKLVRETLVGRAAPCPPQTWTFTVPAGGRHVMDVEVRGECGAEPKTCRHRYTLSDAETGERLFEREWTYTAFPSTPFAWPEGVALVSDGGDGVDAAIASGKPIVVTRPLSKKEGRALKRHVAGGGMAMIVDAKGGWLPIPLRDLPQSYVFRRSERGLAGVTDEMLVCWRPDALVGTSGYVKVADRTVQTLFDSGHKDGLSGMQVGWLWDGAGKWFLMQLPVTAGWGQPALPCGHAGRVTLPCDHAGRVTQPCDHAGLVTMPERDAAADWVLARAMDEFMSGGPALGAKLVMSEDDPLAETWRADGILFGVGKPGGNDVLGTSLVGVGAKKRWQEAKKHAKRGGTVFVHSVDAPKAKLLAEVGLGFKPMKDCMYVTRIGQGGLMDGISNDDLYFSNAKLGDIRFTSENRGREIPKKRKAKGTPMISGALEGNGVVTEPGAFADVPYGKGRIVVSTVKWADGAQNYPKKTMFLLRAVLRNLGVNAADVAVDTEETPISLAECVNRPIWDDPHLKGAVKAWFGGDDDMRYFPVNLCGWSRDSGNHCPVEEVPTTPIRYAGHDFLVSQRKFCEKAMPGAIVLEPGEKTRIPAPMKNLKTLHFLGALAEARRGVVEALKVTCGCGDAVNFEAKVSSGDHVNGYKWSGAVKSGAVGWRGYSKKERAAVLYCWQVPAYKASGVTDFVELENTGSVPIAIVSVTAECAR